MSELSSVMNLEQARNAKEVEQLISQLAINKLRAASNGDRKKYDLVEKQQIQAAIRGIEIINEVEASVFP